MVGLSRENANEAYGLRPDVSIHPFLRPNDFTLKPPGHLPEDAVFKDYPFTFPQVVAGYDAVLLDISNPTFTFQITYWMISTESFTSPWYALRNFPSCMSICLSPLF